MPAPAKLNLVLRVGRPDASGFHPLASWMCTVGLFDRLSIERLAPGAGLRFELVSDDSAPAGSEALDVPRDDRNLVVRAARMLLERAGLPADSGLSIRLRKRIPTAAGLGGGSSDAAATLVGIDRLLDLRLPLATLRGLAGELGSDVAFFLDGPSAWCTGRGEITTPLPAPAKARWAVLMRPAFGGLSTAEVYRRFDAMGLGRPAEELAEPMGFEALRWLDSPALLDRLENDLERPAFALEPRLAALREAAERTLGRVVRMSGSGSTLFTLVDDRETALAAAERLGAEHPVRAVAAPLAPAPK